jgi:general secretion pathway protein B
MSYILDALKKSEQERGHGSAPNVQTLHSSGLSYHSRKSQLWPYFLLAAVVINLGALLYFIMTGSEAGPTAQTLAADYREEATGTETGTRPDLPGATAAGTTATVRDESVFYKPVSLPVERQKMLPAAPAAAEPELAVSQYPAGTVLEMDQLPFEVLQHIPAMEFSAHVYSSNPLQRSLVINGRFMEEGDHLASDLYLSEITADGAIFDFQGQRFHQRIVSSWN